MELALYDSLEGYYVSDRLKVGREGDFFTNVSVGPVFGEILAGQFLEMWSILGELNDFTIVEQGANDGQLARDVIMALAGTPLESARWIIVEPLESLRVKQSHLLENAHVCWVSSSYYLPPFCGVHFSNELFDAVSEMRSCGRFGPEIEGTTVERSSSIFSENRGETSGLCHSP